MIAQKMSANSEASVRAALQNIACPLLQESYADLNAISSVGFDGAQVAVTVQLGLIAQSQHYRLTQALTHQLEEAGFPNVKVRLEAEVYASPSIQRKGQLASVKNIVMVASGKGGVGKSTTAINLALALHAEGAKVGILDADIYGPSMRTMLGISKEIKPNLIDEKLIEPIKKYGLKSMSVAYLSEEKTPMIWRGPMAVRALQQLLEMTLWGELDYLIIDMPPGTGDIHISLAQKVNVSAAVVVTTPQEMALTDARKGVEMFRKVSIPVLGIVENMATHICSHCNHAEAIFGEGGAQQLADEYQISLLGSLPLNKRVREDVDSGKPTVVNEPDSQITRAYLTLANKVGAELWRSNLRVSAEPMIHIIE